MRQMRTGLRSKLEPIQALESTIQILAQQECQQDEIALNKTPTQDRH